MSPPVPDPRRQAPVVVIDIGSNSIKSLVAARGPDGGPVEIESRTIDARISAGIGGAPPRLADGSMDRAVAAVRELLDAAAAHSPGRVRLVATSAVRDAANGEEFRGRVKTAAGRDVRILSGAEEAGLIGRGVLTDPSLVRTGDFHLFDLGGGSLECLRFRSGTAEAAVSLPLGCVRLMERFVGDPSLPFAAADGAAIARHVTDCLAASPFSSALPADSAVVGTGGTLTCARAILGAREGKAMEATDARIAVGSLRDLLEWIGRLPHSGRLAIPGLPPRRADVFPVALATLVALSEAGGFPAYRHSMRNLRWGVAAEALDEAEQAVPRAIGGRRAPAPPARPGDGSH